MKYMLIFAVLLVFSNLHAFDSDPYRVYVKSDRLSFEEGNQAAVSICVQNTSSKNIFFKVYPAPYTTFQPVVYDITGSEEETKVRYRLANRTVDKVTEVMIPREVEIAPNETFYHKVNLSDFYSLKPGKKYKIRAFFLPDAQKSIVVRSENTLNVAMNERTKQVDEPIEVRHASGVNPSEIVLLYLRAEKDQRWSDVVKYLDLERYINSYPDYSMSYNNANDMERRTVMKDFISFLSRPRFDYILDYDISGEEIINEGSSAVVKAYITRHGSVKSFYYEYKFSLDKDGSFWRISSADVTIKKDRRR